MRLWDRLLSRADGYNESLYTGAYYVASTDAGGQSKEGAASGLVRSAREAYAENGVVFAADLIRMALFSEARFKFQSAVDDHLFGNQDLAVLEHPWPNATQGELLARMCQDVTTAGQSYVRRAEPEDGSDALLVQMRPDAVTIISREFTDTAGRAYRRPVGYSEDRGPGLDPQMFGTDEVAHWSPVPDPGARFKGMSWLTPVLREVRADHALATYKTAHLDNGAMPGLVIKYSQKLSDKTVQALRTRLQARYGGPEQAGKTIVLDEGADLTVAGSSLEQLQFEAVTKAGERRICANAGPGMLEILGFEEGDYQAAIRKLADLWARPAWRTVCASLEHLIPTSQQAQPVRLWFDVGGIAALREGELQRAQAFLVKSQGLASAVTAGFTRESAVQAADAGDISLLKPDPSAAPPGSPTGVRAPQAGRPEDLPGVVAPNLPNALPLGPQVMPAVPGGPRGQVNGRARG